jgi:hypothetical protein
MHYRAYFIDAREHVRGAIDVEASDLEEARREVLARSPVHPVVEIWQIDDFVGRFELLGAERQPSSH